MKTVNEIIFSPNTERDVHTAAILNETFKTVIKDEEFDELQCLTKDLCSQHGRHRGLIKGLGEKGLREVLGCLGIFLTQFDEATINSVIDKRKGRKKMYQNGVVSHYAEH